MKTVLAVLSFVALAQAGTLLPVDQSIVKVKSERNGQDYSYSIHENRGIAVEPIIHNIPQIVPQPAVKVSHEVHHTETQMSHQKEEHHEMQQNQEEGNLKNSVPKAKAITEYTLPLVYPYAYSYQPLFYTHNILPTTYQYAYTYPYAYHLNYNLVPIKNE